jgi:hypothetical protein
MSSTTTQTKTLQQALDLANPNDLPAALAQVDLGTLLVPTAPSIWATGANATGSTGVTLPSKARLVGSARVTTGASGAAGSYLVSDAGATPLYPSSTAPGVAALSANGASIQFPAQVMNAVVQYIPQSAVDVTSAFGSDN